MSRAKLGRSVVDTCADCGAVGKLFSKIFIEFNKWLGFDLIGGFCFQIQPGPPSTRGFSYVMNVVVCIEPWVDMSHT